MNNSRDLNYYLDLPYTIELVRQDGSTWFARVLELPGCMTEGDSPEEAAAMIQDAMASWIEIALEDNQPIPEPRPAEEYSGKFLVRVPKSLHRDLVEAAASENVSLNQYIGTELARAVGVAPSIPVVNRSKADMVDDDPYWPGLRAAVRQLLTEQGKGADAQDIDERLCAHAFQQLLEEIARDFRANDSKEAARKIDDMSGKLFMMEPRSAMVVVVRGLLRLLHEQAETQSRLRDAVVEQAVGRRAREYTRKQIEATAEWTIREDAGDYTSWRSQKRILGEEPTAW